MRLLLFSNSTNAGEEYLSYTLPYIEQFIGKQATTALFIPYAGVSISWDEYFNMVSTQLAKVGITLESIHHKANSIEAVQEAEMIIVGGGNTFNLLKTVQENNLIPHIQKKVLENTPYIGWSAGSNLTCPTIRTTNDMPIVEPKNFEALALIPFQINPHYIDEHLEGHAGETREMRLAEFLIANPNMYVAGLREGTMLELTDTNIKLKGNKPCRILKHGQQAQELNAANDFGFLL